MTTPETSPAPPDPASTARPDDSVAPSATADDRRADRLRRQVEELPTISMAEYRRVSRRSFLVGAVGVAAGLGLWRWVQNQPLKERIPGVLRDQLNRNGALWSSFPQKSAPEFSVDRAESLRVNGSRGLKDEIDLSTWTCRVEGPDGAVLDEVRLDAFAALPQRDMVIEHKCVEGWSTIAHWGGARFSDFHARYADRVGDVPFVGLATPDGEYYVGWELKEMLHPQTMLALRLDGQPLSDRHGAPLRLATPNKYGIKTIKRIGVIRYSNERPADFWAERGYDWYAGF